MRELKAAGIICQVHYIPVPMHPFYRDLGIRIEEFSDTISYYREALSIPLYYDLLESDQDFVISKLAALNS